MEVSTTYDSKAFASMGYVLLNTEWWKKVCTKEKIDLQKVSKNTSNAGLLVIKEMEDIKEHFKSIEEGFAESSRFD